jgi:hypothetical protein
VKADAGSLFHEVQHPGRLWTFLAVGVAAVVLLSLLPLARTGPLPVLVILLVAVTMAVPLLLLAARLVVDVDRDAITIRFRFLWPTRRIPLSEVRRAYAMTYRPLLDYGGYGVRLGIKGWAYNVSGNEGVLVETGKGDRVMIGSQRAKELEAAIARAIADRPGRLDP